MKNRHWRRRERARTGRRERRERRMAMQSVKALSLHNGDPAWLDMIMAGLKTIETRTWSTSYRGPLLLVGAKRPENHLSGKAACLVRLADCRPMTAADETAACCAHRPGLYAWVLGEKDNMVRPWPVRGRQGLFNAEVPDFVMDIYTQMVNGKVARWT